MVQPTKEFTVYRFGNYTALHLPDCPTLYLPSEVCHALQTALWNCTTDIAKCERFAESTLPTIRHEEK